MNNPVKPEAVRRRINNQSMGEEIANAISHGAGALLAIAGAVVLIISTALHGRAIDIISAAIYGGSLILLYLASTLYHSLTPYIAKRLFQIFDHCAIFILILGSYAPLSLSLLGGAAGWVLFGWNILLTVIGLVLNSISVKRFQTVSMVLYLLMGWSAAAALKALPTLPQAAWILLISGGLAYSFGIIFFALKKPRFTHFIWHLFVLAGSVLHYFLILLYVL
jgi:hemolysin III